MPEEMVKINYFSFTTLSTVGFGDFNPRSNLERLYMAFGMLLGVAIFSSILGNFIEMLDVVKDFQKDIEYGNNLLCFFGLFKRLNKGEELPLGLRHQVEAYFAYRWEHWKNLAIYPTEDEEKDQKTLEMLEEADDLLDRTFTRYMYLDFLRTYTPIFEYRKNEHAHSRYVWADTEYRAFMLAILRNLEPRNEEPDVALVEELDEFNEVVFFMKGFYCVGYSINN